MKIMENFIDYVMEEALILIPVLFIFGKLLKETPKLANWLIPYILLVVGVVLAFFLIGFTVHGIVQGVLVSGTAVFTHQLFKQAKNKDKENVDFYVSM